MKIYKHSMRVGPGTAVIAAIVWLQLGLVTPSWAQPLQQTTVHPNLAPNYEAVGPSSIEPFRGFSPPKTPTQHSVGSHGIQTEFSSGLTRVLPRKTNPSQFGNYVSPIAQDDQQETDDSGSATTEDGKRQIETSGRIELIIERYPDGKEQVKREVTQDLEGNYFNHGKWQLLSPRQDIMSEGEYRFGRMEGQWRRWHPAKAIGIFANAPFKDFQGPYQSFADFTDGEMDGVWRITDRFEQTIFEMPFRNGKRDGTAIWYHTNGIKMREVSFRDGVLDGPLFEYNKQEEVIRQEEYREGRKVVRETQFYRPKQPLSQSFYLDAKLELAGTDNWWEAKPAGYVTTGERIQDGPTGLWYQNGQPQLQGQFENGMRVGTFTGWHSNGQKEVIGQFEKDKKVGKWTWWHANGFKRVEGSYEQGEPVGEWIWWNEDGSVKNRETMSIQSVIELDETSHTPSDSLRENENDGKEEVDGKEVETGELLAPKKSQDVPDIIEIPGEIFPYKSTVPNSNSPQSTDNASSGGDAAKSADKEQNQDQSEQNQDGEKSNQVEPEEIDSVPAKDENGSNSAPTISPVNSTNKLIRA